MQCIVNIIYVHYMYLTELSC